MHCKIHLHYFCLSVFNELLFVPKKSLAVIKSGTILITKLLLDDMNY